MSEHEYKMALCSRNRYITAGFVASFATAFLLVMLSQFTKPAIESKGSFERPEQKDSLRKLALANEDEDSGTVKDIGEAMKHSVVTNSSDKQAAEEVASKTDQIVEKDTNEGLKPGELVSRIDSYRESQLMNASRIGALHHQFQNSSLPPAAKLRGHRTLELFSRAVVNRRIAPEHADLVLASLFHGDIPNIR